MGGGDHSHCRRRIRPHAPSLSAKQRSQGGSLGDRRFSASRRPSPRVTASKMIAEARIRALGSAGQVLLRKGAQGEGRLGGAQFLAKKRNHRYNGSEKQIRLTAPDLRIERTRARCASFSRARATGGQALENAQNGNGQLLEIVGMDLGLAPRPLGFGATSAWVWRRAGLGSMGPYGPANAAGRARRLTGRRPRGFRARMIGDARPCGAPNEGPNIRETDIDSCAPREAGRGMGSECVILMTFLVCRNRRARRK
jgi:hypothetical protein